MAPYEPLGDADGVPSAPDAAAWVAETELDDVLAAALERRDDAGRVPGGASAAPEIILVEDAPVPVPAPVPEAAAAAWLEPQLALLTQDEDQSSDGEQSPEVTIEATAGPPAAGAGPSDDGGSSAAVSPFNDDGYGNRFGAEPRGPFEGLPRPTLEVPEQVAEAVPTEEEVMPEEAAMAPAVSPPTVIPEELAALDVLPPDDPAARPPGAPEAPEIVVLESPPPVAEVPADLSIVA